jgi:hypothetical protein
MKVKTLLRKPNVRVLHNPTAWHPGGAGMATLVADEPILLEPVSDPVRERSVLIYDSIGRRIVTAIELISPWNKALGTAIESYLRKRQKYVDSQTHLVEIDLIRIPYVVPAEARVTYRVTVASPGLPGIYLYPITLQSKLPIINVPLRPKDPAVVLNLQELIEKVYLMGRYDIIEYAQALQPPFTAPEQEWVDQVHRAAKKI